MIIYWNRLLMRVTENIVKLQILDERRR